jgi:hypothetical protein
MTQPLTVRHDGETYYIREAARLSQDPHSPWPCYVARAFDTRGQSYAVVWTVNREFLTYDRISGHFVFAAPVDAADPNLCKWDEPALVWMLVL